MNLLESIAVELTCPSCGARYRVSLEDIARSHQALREGCPVSDAHVRECPQATFAKLASEAALQELERAWARIERELTSGGAGIVVTGSREAVEPPCEKDLDEALAESFPASDPPFWTLGWSPSAANAK